jgi:hypothetical protein
MFPDDMTRARGYRSYGRAAHHMQLSLGGIEAAAPAALLC